MAAPPNTPPWTRFNDDEDPLRIVVSVLALREGFDKTNISVIAVLRATDADMLLEQIVGRGLRLMFPPYRYHELQEAKQQAFADLKKHEKPHNSLDFLYIVEHPRFRSFYDDLRKDGYLIASGDSSESGPTGDIVPVEADPDRIPGRDIAWPVAVQEEARLPDLSATSVRDLPSGTWKLDAIRKVLATLAITDRHLETNTKADTWELADKYFDYAHYLRTTARAIATEGKTQVLTARLAEIAEIVDDYTTHRLFGQNVDFGPRRTTKSWPTARSRTTWSTSSEASWPTCSGSLASRSPRRLAQGQRPAPHLPPPGVLRRGTQVHLPPRRLLRPQWGIRAGRYARLAGLLRRGPGLDQAPAETRPADCLPRPIGSAQDLRSGLSGPNRRLLLPSGNQGRRLPPTSDRRPQDPSRQAVVPDHQRRPAGGHGPAGDMGVPSAERVNLLRQWREQLPRVGSDHAKCAGPGDRAAVPRVALCEVTSRAATMKAVKSMEIDPSTSRPSGLPNDTPGGVGTSPASGIGSGMGVPPVRPAGVSPASPDAPGSNPPPIDKRHGHYLPHWTTQGATYAVTFRLADALPAKVAEAYRQERQDLLVRAPRQGREPTTFEQRELARLYSTRIEALLDAGRGSCFLKDPHVAEAVQSALEHFDGQRYDLVAWCVMPNHVHVVFRPLGEHQLGEILHSWKSFTAKQANKVLRRQGPFWQEEYYDHLIRGEEDFNHCVSYVLENPARANLTDWPYVGFASGGRDARLTHEGDAHAT